MCSASTQCHTWPSAQDQCSICVFCISSEFHFLVFCQGSVQYLFSVSDQNFTSWPSAQDQCSICVHCLRSECCLLSFSLGSMQYMCALLRIKVLLPSSLPRISVLFVCIAQDKNVVPCLQCSICVPFLGSKSSYLIICLRSVQYLCALLKIKMLPFCLLSNYEFFIYLFIFLFIGYQSANSVKSFFIMFLM